MWHQYRGCFIYAGQISNEAFPVLRKGSAQDAAHNNLKGFSKTALLRYYALDLVLEMRRLRLLEISHFPKATNC